MDVYGDEESAERAEAAAMRRALSTTRPGRLQRMTCMGDSDGAERGVPSITTGRVPSTAARR